MFENKRTLNAGRREPADASSSQEDYLIKSEGCKTARLFGAYIYSWLRGTSLPSIDNLYALSELLSVPMDCLITGNRKKKFSWDMVREDCE